MALDPYISPNQAVVCGSVAADGENTTDAPSGKVVKGKLTTAAAKAAPEKKPEPAKEEPKVETPAPAPEPDPKPTPAKK